MAKELDEHVEDFRTRPLADGPYTFLAADALVMKVREGGPVVPVHTYLATGVNSGGHREILGLHVASSENEARWLTFFRDLLARGLTGVKLVTSDAHHGLVEAIGAPLPAASWHRCRTHYAANLMSMTPKASWPWVTTLLHSVFDQPEAGEVHAQFDRVLDALWHKLPACAEHLESARQEILAFASYPKQIWRQIWSNNPNERLNKEIRRRTNVVGIFPDHDSIIRLVAAVLAEQHDEWAQGRRYMNLNVPAESQHVGLNRGLNRRLQEGDDNRSRGHRRLTKSKDHQNVPYTTTRDLTSLSEHFISAIQQELKETHTSPRQRSH